jgi:hypothetical protein
MKKFILFLLLVSFLSCGNVDLSKPKYQPVTVITNQVSHGTLLEEFLEIAGDRAEKTYEDFDEMSYKVYQYNKDDEIVMTAKYRFRKFTGNKRKFYLSEISSTN